MVHFAGAGKMFQGTMIPAAALHTQHTRQGVPQLTPGHTPARLRLRSRGTLRRSMLTRAAGILLALRAKVRILQTASFPLPGAPSPGRQGALPVKKQKPGTNVPGLGDATANQEVVSPLIAVVCAVDLNVSPFKVPAHSIASSSTNVKHKSKKAALCAAFLYDFARKAAQYVCRLPMDRAYNAMPMIDINIA